MKNYLFTLLGLLLILVFGDAHAYQPPCGAAGGVQYNNSGQCGAFGNYNGTTLAIGAPVTGTSFNGYLSTGNISQFTNNSNYLSNITGLVTAGSNITLSGSGTSGSPYHISASGGSPAGGNGYIQYNESGAFASDGNILYQPTFQRMQIPNIYATSEVDVGAALRLLWQSNPGQILFPETTTATGFVTSDSNLFWDNTGKVLGLGTSSPSSSSRLDSVAANVSIAAPTVLTASLLPETLIGSPSDSVSLIYGPQDPGSFYGNENAYQGSGYQSDCQTLNYTIYAYDIINGTEYTSAGRISVPVTDSVCDYSSLFTVSLNWPTATNGDGSAVSGYILSGPFGSVDLGGGTSYTDDGTGQSASYTSFGGFTASGQSFDFQPFNLATAPGGGVYTSEQGSDAFVTDYYNNGSSFWVVHNISGGGTGWNSYLIYDVNENGYFTTSSNTYYQTSGIGGGTNPYPTHYGIQANGSNWNEDYQAYAKETSPSTLYSSTYASSSTSDPNDGNYYYTSLTLSDFGGGTSARILESPDSSGFNYYADTSSSTIYYTALSDPFSSGNTVTPNTTTNVSILAENSAASVSQPVQIMANTTNAGGSPGMGLSLNGTQIADWRWNPANGAVKFDNSDNGQFDFGQNSTVYNSIGSSFLTLNKGAQNYYDLKILNANGSTFFEAQATNNVFRFGGNSSYGSSNPLMSALLPSGFGGLHMEKTDTSTNPFLDFYNSTGTQVYSVNSSGYVTSALIGNGTSGIKVASATTDKIGFYGTNPITQPTGDVATALSNLGLVSSPTVSVPIDSTLHFTSGNLGLNLAHNNTWTNQTVFDTGASNFFEIGDYTGLHGAFTLITNSAQLTAYTSSYPDGFFNIQDGLMYLGDYVGDVNGEYISINDLSNGGIGIYSGQYSIDDTLANFKQTVDIASTINFQTTSSNNVITTPNSAVNTNTGGNLNITLGNGLSATSGATTKGGSTTYYTGTGGAATSTAHTGGAGGDYIYNTGNGGAATGTGSLTNTGGTGGRLQFNGGTGGTAGNSSTRNNPGQGGGTIFFGGPGGALGSGASGDAAGQGGSFVGIAGDGGTSSTSGTTSGAGGIVYLAGGAPGPANGGSTAGARGWVALATTNSGSASGLVGVRLGSTAPTAALDIVGSTTSNASLRLRSGTAPTSPNDGDLWYDGSHFQGRIGSTTYQLDQQLPLVVSKVALTAQAADIGSTTITSTAGVYDIDYVLEDTTADATAGSVTLTISWTDGAGSTTSTATQVLTTKGRASGRIALQLASGNLTYAISHTGSYATAKYALYATTTRIQ